MLIPLFSIALSTLFNSNLYYIFHGLIVITLFSFQNTLESKHYNRETLVI